MNRQQQLEHKCDLIKNELEKFRNLKVSYSIKKDSFVSFLISNKYINYQYMQILFVDKIEIYPTKIIVNEMAQELKNKMFYDLVGV